MTKPAPGSGSALSVKAAHGGPLSYLCQGGRSGEYLEGLFALIFLDEWTSYYDAQRDYKEILRPLEKSMWPSEEGGPSSQVVINSQQQQAASHPQPEESWWLLHSWAWQGPWVPPWLCMSHGWPRLNSPPPSAFQVPIAWPRWGDYIWQTLMSGGPAKSKQVSWYWQYNPCHAQEWLGPNSTTLHKKLQRNMPLGSLFTIQHIPNRWRFL